MGDKLIGSVDPVGIEITRILDQLERAYDGDAWHGPPLLKILKGVTHEDAARHPAPDAHSIWELVLHLTTWFEIPRRRIRGEAIEPSDDEDWPTSQKVNISKWELALQDLDMAHKALLAAVEQLSDADLDKLVSGQDYNHYVMLHGVVQHSLYHAGQIAILRRAIEVPPLP